MRNGTKLVAVLAATFLFAACSSGSDSSGPSGIDPGKAGTLRVSLTDKPAVSLKAVKVTITAVRVHQSASVGTGDAGWREMPVTAAMPVDLMQLQGGVVQELCSEQLEAGAYQQIRLQLEPNTGAAPPYRNSVTMMDDTVQPIDVPGDSIKIVRPFTIAAGATTDLVLDFDATKSCRQRGDETWYMQPVITATSQTN